MEHHRLDPYPIPKELVRDIIARLKEIPDGCAECFPFDTIDEPPQEYLAD